MEIDKDWEVVEKQLEELCIQIAKVRYKDIPVIKSRGMRRVLSLVAEEAFKALEDRG